MAGEIQKPGSRVGTGSKTSNRTSLVEKRVRKTSPQLIRASERDLLIYFIPTITLHFITMGDMLSAETGPAVWSVVLQMMDKIRAGPPVEQERLESQD